AGSLAFAALAVPSAYAAADGDIVITDVAVSGGGDFAIGGSKTFNVSVTAQDDSGIQTMGLHIRVPGTVYKAPDQGLTCTGTTTRTCTGTSTYSTVKTVKSTSTGALRTTAKATADGYWRWTYAGDAVTSGAKATGDYVDVN
ncbi:hypothetical protein ACFW0I_37520, partial [[Kitasatospora] papulosa]